MLCDGHVLLEDSPGLAKTLIARSFAQSSSLGFARIQFTPDLMPVGRHGLLDLRPAAARVRFLPGPIFTQPSPRRRDQPRPAEDAGGAARSDAGAAGDDRGRDPRCSAAVPRASRRRTRSSTRAHIRCPRRSSTVSSCASASAIPSRDDESRCSPARSSAATDEVELRRRSSSRALSRCSSALEQVHVARDRGLHRRSRRGDTRRRSGSQVGASPRGSLALLKLSRAKAALDGRDFVVPEDVKAIAIPALAHRLTLRPELWVQRVRGEDVVAEALETVPTPPAEDSLRAAG